MNIVDLIFDLFDAAGWEGPRIGTFTVLFGVLGVVLGAVATHFWFMSMDDPGPYVITDAIFMGVFIGGPLGAVCGFFIDRVRASDSETAGNHEDDSSPLRKAQFEAAANAALVWHDLGPFEAEDGVAGRYKAEC